MTTITITKPDDWHIHLRDGDFLKTTVAHAAERFGRVIVMPNLKPPICELEQARLYHAAILSVLPVNTDFKPLMTLYLTDNTTQEMLASAKNSGLVYGCKLYPAGSTTHSDQGVTAIEKIYPLLTKMEEIDLPLLIHGEVTQSSIDIFDREAKFIDEILAIMCQRFPSLRIVLEHITTQEAVDFVLSSSSKVAATITPHHLLLNRNDLLSGGIKPHHYCLPVLKRKQHQEALIRAATSGNPKFFLGTDSAPHAKGTKENDCGCAGIYTAHAAIELCCEIFESEDALNKIEAFTSLNGADFYRLPYNDAKIKLIKESWIVPASYPYGDTQLVPFRAGQPIHWKLVNKHE